MIENMRGRSTETKYGRIPLWLYEAGVSLQAIATYGWLHGKYGHFERVVPSYATLAKELKVSRGSVIAYVKELVAAGAVRIEVSDVTDRCTNTYVLAVEAPFQIAAPRTLSTLGWAYAVSGARTRRIKLGHSRNPRQRLSDLQSGSAETLQIIWQAKGGAALERHLHDHFAERRLHGEWFDFDNLDAVALISMAAESFRTQEAAR